MFLESLFEELEAAGEVEGDPRPGEGQLQGEGDVVGPVEDGDLGGLLAPVEGPADPGVVMKRAWSWSEYIRTRAGWSASGRGE